MGWLRKTFGIQQQIDATNRNADAQVAATETAARDQAAAAQAAARAAADQQKQAVERANAERAATDALGGPLEQAEVRIGQMEGTLSQRTRSRRARFGQGSSTGVSIS